MKTKAKENTKAKKAEFPDVLYVAYPSGGCGAVAYPTVKALAENFGTDVTVGIYTLEHMTRITTEVHLTPCGPSKAEVKR